MVRDFERSPLVTGFSLGGSTGGGDRSTGAGDTGGGDRSTGAGDTLCVRKS